MQAGEAYLCEKMGDVTAAMRIYVEAVETANEKLRSSLAARPRLLYEIGTTMLGMVGRGTRLGAKGGTGRRRG